MTLTFEDCIFERAVELGGVPVLVYQGKEERWVCMCNGHKHADDPNTSFFLTHEALVRVARRAEVTQ
jgi:hypothetical protein